MSGLHCGRFFDWLWCFCTVYDRLQKSLLLISDQKCRKKWPWFKATLEKFVNPNSVHIPGPGTALEHLGEGAGARYHSPWLWFPHHTDWLYGRLTFFDFRWCLCGLFNMTWVWMYICRAHTDMMLHLTTVEEAKEQKIAKFSSFTFNIPNISTKWLNFKDCHRLEYLICVVISQLNTSIVAGV